MTDTTISDAERLAELERQLAQLAATQQAERDAAKRRQKHLERIPGADDLELKKDSLAGAHERMQQARIAASNEAMALRQKAYDEQLAHNAPAIEKIEGEIRDVSDRERVEEQKYQAALAKLAEKRKSLRAKLDALQEMPPLPPVEPQYDEQDIDTALNWGAPANNGYPRRGLADLEIVDWVWDSRWQPITRAMARREEQFKAAGRR